MTTPVGTSTEPVAHRALRAWARSALAVVACRVDVVDPWGVPGDLPTVLAVNHTNALADVAALVAVAPRFPHFLAAATWWRHPAARVLFRLGGVHPVHRARDGAGTHHNHSTFAACREALARGEHLAIFPEGELNTGRELMPLRTGAARIALSAAGEGIEGVQIVPVGIAYGHRDRFRTTVAVCFGEPLRVDRPSPGVDSGEEQAVRALTASLRRHLLDAVALATAGGRGRATSRSRAGAELAALSPAALIGAVSNAPVLLAGLLANRAAPTGWRTSVKGLTGTVLLPATWAVQATVLTRRLGLPRALAVTSATGAGGGWAVLAWVDRWQQLRRPVPGPVGRGERPAVDLAVAEPAVDVAPVTAG